MMNRIERKVKAKIKLLRSELLYAIGNYAYVEGDVMQAPSEKERAIVIDITQEGNIDRVNRILNLAYDELVEIMFPYTKEVCEDEELRDDILTEPSEYVISLLLPVLYSKTSVNLLSKLCHEYMVCRVLSDWLNITKHDAWQSWHIRLADISAQIRTRLNARRGAIRRTQSPF